MSTRSRPSCAGPASAPARQIGNALSASAAQGPGDTSAGQLRDPEDMPWGERIAAGFDPNGTLSPSGRRSSQGHTESRPRKTTHLEWDATESASITEMKGDRLFHATPNAECLLPGGQYVCRICLASPGKSGHRDRDIRRYLARPARFESQVSMPVRAPPCCTALVSGVA